MEKDVLVLVRVFILKCLLCSLSPPGQERTKGCAELIMFRDKVYILFTNWSRNYSAEFFVWRFMFCFYLKAEKCLKLQQLLNTKNFIFIM